MKLFQDENLAKSLQTAFVNAEIYKAAEAEHKSLSTNDHVETSGSNTRTVSMVRSRKHRCGLGITCYACAHAGSCVRAATAW